MYSVGCFLAVTISSIWGTDVHSIMVYLTIWTYLVLCLYMLLTAGLAVFYCKMKNDKSCDRLHSVSIAKSRVADSKQVTVGVVSQAFEHDTEISSKSDPNSIQRTEDCSKGRIHSSEYDTGTTLPSLKDIDNTNLFMKTSWLLGSIIYVFAIVVSVIYFVALFPSIGVTDGFIHDLNMHAFNTVLVLIDVAIVARPIRLLHVIYPVMYGVCYLVFSAIYWSFDHTRNVLYPVVLDWNYPGTTSGVLVGLTVIGLPLVQLAHFGFYRLRLSVHRRIYGDE